MYLHFITLSFQLIYDFSGGGGTIGVVSHLSDPEKQRKFTELGMELPSPRLLVQSCSTIICASYVKLLFFFK